MSINLPVTGFIPEPIADTSFVSINDFLPSRSGIPADMTLAIREALAYCKEQGVRKLVFSYGTYHIASDHAVEEFVSLTNNSSGLKRIGFLLDGFKDFEIDGGGAHFVCRGFIVPFLLENSQGVTLRNFSIDFERTFHSEGKILSVGNDCVDVAFSSKFPYRICEGQLTFTGISSEDAETEYPAWHLLEFDANKYETAFMAPDYYSDKKRSAIEIAPGQVRVFVEGVKATVGNIFVFGAADRRVPAIAIQDCSDLRLKNVTIHHAGAMGIIAQRSSDLFLEKVFVTPSQGRMLSTTADATHFASCSGKIELIDCLFENQEDDATNIHGVYAQITKIVSPTELDLQLIHYQQLGFDFVRPGMRLELVDRRSLNALGIADVKSFQQIDDRITRVILESDCPETLHEGDVVADLASQPEVLIRGCVIRKNRARGVLLGSRGRTIVEANYFHTPGAAILMEGDGNFWFEQAGVRDLLIKNNCFDNCNFGVWGSAVIQVGAGIDETQRPISRYNRNIQIEANTFHVFDHVPLIHGYSIDGLVFRRNKTVRTKAYPSQRAQGEAIQITHSVNVHIEE